MPLKLPNLDNRTYTDFVEEARRLIPQYAPEWTNYNPSDPGITLVELFAYLSEMLIYRLNRVTDANIYAFLKLIKGPEWEPSAEKTLTEEIREMVVTLHAPNRAVTCEDFECLARAANPRVKRAFAVPKCNLTYPSRSMRFAEKPAHMSVIVVPDEEESNVQELIEIVKNYLEPRLLMTTQLHVVEPRYVTIGMRFTLYLKADAWKEDVLDEAIKALKRFFHPLSGGPDGTGWAFGQDVYVSEIYELLDNLPGVNYITRTIGSRTHQLLDELIVGDEHIGRLVRNNRGELVAVNIFRDELVDAQIGAGDLIAIESDRNI